MLDYSAYNSGVVVDLNLGEATGTTGISNINVVVGSTEDDVITGNAQYNIFLGGTGNDIYNLRGDWWNNLILEGADEGTDTLGLSSVATDLSFTISPDGTIGGTIAVTGGGTAATYNYMNFEGVIGGTGSDSYYLQENWSNISIEELAGSGTDILDFSAVVSNLNVTVHTDGMLSVFSEPSDILKASGLNNLHNFEKLIGGSGDDLVRFDKDAAFAGSVHGGGGQNTLEYQAYVTAVNVDLSANTATGTTLITDFNHVIGGEAADTITGDANANMLFGNESSDIIVGGLGDDTIVGGYGDDILEGGDGADHIEGSEGRDKLIYANDPGGVIVDLSLFDDDLAAYLAIDGYGNTDTLSGVEDVDGSDFNDTLIGDSVVNKLDGGLGDDTLIGGAADDELIGGIGTDTVSYVKRRERGEC